MNAMPLPKVLSLAGIELDGAYATRLFTILYPIVATDLHRLISSVYPTIRSSAYQSQGPFGCKRQTYLTAVSGLFPSLLSKTFGEGTKYRKNIPVLALLLSDNPVSLLAWRKS